MSFFTHYFKLIDDGTEQSVCCPFPHYTSNGLPYQESNPSAHVNTKEGLFHCKVCSTGYNETSFIKALLQCTYSNAARLAKAFSNTESMHDWSNQTTLPDDERTLCHSFGITDQVIAELQISSLVPGTLMFPVSMWDKLIDIRTYAPNQKPKVKSRTGAAYGLVIPFDHWQSQPVERVTLICAGEKDMAVARSQGFNAITITGGENTLPLSPMWFKDRNVVILYDNDNAGIVGAHKLASYLMDYCRTVKVCTKFHEVCKEEKEDITDFFNKYHGTKEQLIHYMNMTPVYTKQDAVHNSKVPKLTLQDATHPEYINKTIRSNIQVAAISEVQYMLPTAILGEKLKDSGQDDTMIPGEIREWNLDENTLCHVLHLIDNNFNEAVITENIRNILKIPKKERYIRITPCDKTIVYKAYVTEMIESLNTDTMPIEYTAYSIGTRLESGKKYMVTYRIVPHPYKGQQLVMIITDAVGANDSVSNFAVTPNVIEELSQVQQLPGTVTDKVNALVQKAKGLIGYDGNELLIKTLDLAYHTVLGFHFGNFTNVRGYLDTLIIGESRVGKSSTAEALRLTYQLGVFTSLAGNSATIPGLVGGSTKTSGSGAYQTKAGLIPQNHKGLIIFEEFGKCNSNIVAELTDIRSSNEVRITRISGTLSLPAMVRMISLSNVKAMQGEIKSIASYPNGISIVTELVSTAEDIARYDLIAVLGDKGNTIIDPCWKPETPFEPSVYQTKVRWVWSRSPEQIIISDDVTNYIIDCCNELNKEFNCHIKIFGTEAWKKVTRLAIAVAGYVVSTDPSYENIIVQKEHVEYAVAMLRELYDNPVFRLKEYVLHERRYNSIDDEGVMLLQLLYAKCPALLLLLEQEARTSRNTLMAAVGLDNTSYNGFMNTLIRGSFVKLSSSEIFPTERFRLGMARINRSASLPRLGENNV